MWERSSTLKRPFSRLFQAECKYMDRDFESWSMRKGHTTPPNSQIKVQEIGCPLFCQKCYRDNQRVPVVWLLTVRSPWWLLFLCNPPPKKEKLRNLYWHFIDNKIKLYQLFDPTRWKDVKKKLKINWKKKFLHNCLIPSSTYKKILMPIM